MYLGIDCGTQGTKALLCDEHGTALGRGYAPHALIERESGAREQEPTWWVDALRGSVLQAIRQASLFEAEAPVLALGVSGQQHGLVVLDEHMQVIRPAKLWNDTETAQHNSALIDRLGGREAFYKRFGIVPMTGYTVSKLAWLAEREPENFKRIRHILLPHEFLNFWLTGTMRAEYGDASGTAFFDVRNRAWIREILDTIDGGSGQLFNALPPLMASDDVVGTVRPEVAQELGIRAGCLVAAGGGDNMMGAIGTGNVREGTCDPVASVPRRRCIPTADRPAQRSNRERRAVLLVVGWLAAAGLHDECNQCGDRDGSELMGKTVADLEPALESTPPGAGRA